MSNMPVTLQMQMLEKHAKDYHRSNPDFDPQTIDYEAEVDPTLSYPENLDNFIDKYHMHENMSQERYEQKTGVDVGFEQRHSTPEREYKRQDPYAGKSMSEMAFIKHQKGDYTTMRAQSQPKAAPSISSVFFGNTQKQSPSQAKRFGRQELKEKWDRFNQKESVKGIRNIGGHILNPVFEGVKQEQRRNNAIKRINAVAYRRAFNREAARVARVNAKHDARQKMTVNAGRFNAAGFLFGMPNQQHNQKRKEQRKRLEGLFDW